MDAVEIVVAVLAGVIGGIASGLFGVGGGAIFVPTLVLLLDEPQHAAQGTSLGIIIVTAISGTLVNARYRNIDYDVMTRVAPVAVIAVVIGSYLASLLSEDALQKVFGVAVVAVALRMIYDTLKKRGIKAAADA
jgi:uncharacterized protein